MWYRIATITKVENIGLLHCNILQFFCVTLFIKFSSTDEWKKLCFVNFYLRPKLNSMKGKETNL